VASIRLFATQKDDFRPLLSQSERGGVKVPISLREIGTFRTSVCVANGCYQFVFLLRKKSNHNIQTAESGLNIVKVPISLREIGTFRTSVC
jgi:hypothetical protein